MNDEKKRRLREIIVEFEEDIKDNYWEFFIRKILGECGIAGLSTVKRLSQPAKNEIDGFLQDYTMDEYQNLYDKSGTTIVVCDETGQIGTVSTTLPIQKAEVAEQGVVAAILEDGDSTWIQYFDQQGEMIASFRTAMDATGYPMDLSLSSNGMLLGVSYLKMENGVPKTELNFYNSRIKRIILVRPPLTTMIMASNIREPYKQYT